MSSTFPYGTLISSFVPAVIRRSRVAVPVDVDILPARYRDPERIASGGMGEIYLATDSALGRTVVIKVLADRYAEDASVRERFTREALAAARLSGEPNTVTIYDVGEHKGHPFIVMQHLGGGSLADVLEREGAQPPERAFRWLEEGAQAIDGAHANGIVHRDVKPGNLMLDDDGHVHVADFGIASAAGMDSLTMTGTVLGTAGYLPPEQAQGDRAGPPSDLYSLAVVAWELLTGKRPFESDNATTEAAAHVNAPVPSVGAASELPCELDPIFERALAKNPSERYGSAGEFVAALRSAYSDEAGATRRFDPMVLSPPSPAPPMSRRLWPLLTLLLLAGAAAGALLAYALMRSDGGPKAPRQVVTRVETVTTQGEVTTVEEPVTVTGSPAPANPSGAALNNAGFRKMQRGDYAGALPLLERAVQRLQGSGSLDEAYADYNLAFTRFALGRCDGVLDLLDRSESIQGTREPIDRLREEAQQRC
jgi:tRNA A-37 threonylcarbamoyl transferase component Bud32